MSDASYMLEAANVWSNKHWQRQVCRNYKQTLQASNSRSYSTIVRSMHQMKEAANFKSIKCQTLQSDDQMSDSTIGSIKCQTLQLEASNVRLYNRKHQMSDSMYNRKHQMSDSTIGSISSVPTTLSSVPTTLSSVPTTLEIGSPLPGFHQTKAKYRVHRWISW